MRTLIALAAASVSIGIVDAGHTRGHIKHQDVDDSRFNSWRSSRSKRYGTTEEQSYRMAIFKQNAAALHNYMVDHGAAAGTGAGSTADGSGAAAGGHDSSVVVKDPDALVLELNEYADLSNDEFVARYTGYVKPAADAAGAAAEGEGSGDEVHAAGDRSAPAAAAGDADAHPYTGPVPATSSNKLRGSASSSTAVPQQQDPSDSSDSVSQARLLANPASVDWAAAGAVTTPVTQGSCGACYAFASSSAIESFIKIKKNGALTSLSPQHIVDCSYGQGGNSGCVGGHPSSSYAFVAANGGIASAADYPYRTAVGGCALAKGTKIAATISGYETVPTGTNADSGLESAVAGQPVSVAVCATGPAWQFYKSGVITSACPAAVNHGVLVVGYGTATDGKTGYWKIKNSWGNTWGEEGYLRIARGTAYNGVSGQCGVYTDMTYPK